MSKFNSKKKTQSQEPKISERTSQLGMSVMIDMLCGADREETSKAIISSIGKVIEDITLIDDEIKITFEDQSRIMIWDDGQSWCESRYTVCDEDLSNYSGHKLVSVIDRDCEVKDENYGVHEINFLDVVTDKGKIQFRSHNEHNGYYGGFSMKAKRIGRKSDDEWK